MSATPKKTTRTWDHYVKEASLPPFELVVDDDTTITIEAPTGGQLIAGEELFNGGGSIAEALKVVCGDAGDQVLELVRGAPAGAMNQLLTDIMHHFNFGDAMAAAGEANSRT